MACADIFDAEDHVSLGRVKELFVDLQSYDAQYLPTFKKILKGLDSDNALDIVLKYNGYKNVIEGVGALARSKHIKSLRDKLVGAGLLDGKYEFEVVKSVGGTGSTSMVLKCAAAQVAKEVVEVEGVAEEGAASDEEETPCDSSEEEESEADFEHKRGFGDGNLDEFKEQLKYVSKKAAVLNRFYELVIDHVHLLPPQVITKIVRLGFNNFVAPVYGIYGAQVAKEQLHNGGSR